MLYSDNRAAPHLTAGTSEWRTKALVNRVMGAKPLANLGDIILEFRPTAQMLADCLTKFMGAGKAKQCRDRIGVVLRSV